MISQNNKISDLKIQRKALSFCKPKIDIVWIHVIICFFALKKVMIISR